VNNSNLEKVGNLIVEPKFSSTLDMNEGDTSGDRNLQRHGTFQTGTSVSENYIENANLDTLE